MRKESNRKNVKIYIRVIALFLCALIFSSCTNCASCNFADLFNIKILPDASEKENASGIEGSSDEEKQTHTHSEMPTENQTELPTEEPTEPVPEWNEDIKLEIQNAYGRISPMAKSPETQFLGRFGKYYAVYVVDTTIHDYIGAHYVEGYEFRYRGSRQIFLYSDNRFFSLPRSLNENLIDKNDLEKIHAEFVDQNAWKYKMICDAPPNNIIYGYVTITLQPEYNYTLYRVEDFSEVGCTRVDEPLLFTALPNQICRMLRIFLPAQTEEELMAAVRKLEARDDVYCVMINHELPSHSMSDNREYHSCLGDYWAAEKIELFDAWEIETGSNTVLVGIIDTGIDGTNEKHSQKYLRFAAEHYAEI